MNTLTTYFYNGAYTLDLTSTSVVVDAITYWTMYAEVVIFYGAYNGASTVPAVEPVFLPPLSDVQFNAKFYRYVAGPTSKYATAKLINREDIYDADDRRDCLGTKFTFASPIVAPDDCVNDYCLVWSCNQIEMPYGADMIYIAGQSGVTAPETLC